MRGGGKVASIVMTSLSLDESGRAWRAVCVAVMAGWLAAAPALAKEAEAAAPEPTENVIVEGVTFTPEQQKLKWYPSFQRWAQQDAKEMPDKDSVLVIGSSSIVMWKTIKNDLAPAKVVHRGFGGSTMAQVLKMLDFFQRYPSDTVLVYEGDNDLASKLTPEEFLAQAKELVAGLRETNPDVRIYFISVKPSIRRAHLMEKMAKANTLVKAMCEADPNLEFIDVYTPMLNAEGQPKPEIFLKDDLHMAPEGYVIWTEAVREKLKL